MNAVLKNYANVLAIIMRLRQLCCHPSLCIKAVQKLQKAMDVMEQLREQLQGTATSFYGGLIVKSVELADFKNWL